MVGTQLVLRGPSEPQGTAEPILMMLSGRGRRRPRQGPWRILQPAGAGAKVCGVRRPVGSLDGRHSLSVPSWLRH